MGGIKGDVIDIGVLRATLMEIGDWVNGDLYNGRVVRVANSFVFKEPVYNYSSYFPFLWDEIVIPIKYGSDYKLVRELLQKLANEILKDYASGAREAWENVVRRYMIEKASVEPAITIVANDNWVAFTLRYVVDYKKRRSTKDRLFTQILEEFEKACDSISIASETLDVTMHKKGS